MKIWKVYAKCCIATNPIEKVDESAIATAIEENFEYRIDDGTITFDESNYDKIHSKFVNELEENFKKNGVLGVGDYQLVISDTTPCRPDVCNWGLIL